MKKGPLAVLLFALFLAVTPGSTAQTPVVTPLPGNGAPTYPYTNKVENVSFNIPAGWAIKEIDQAGQGYIVRMAAIRSSISSTDLLHDNINLVVETLNPPMTLSEYFDANLKNFPAGLREFKAEKTGDLKAANANGKYLVYSHKSIEVPIRLKVVVFIFLKGNKAYCLTCTSTVDSFANFEDLYMAIGQSFKFD
jgi:hypothetical protein